MDPDGSIAQQRNDDGRRTPKGGARRCLAGSDRADPALAADRVVGRGDDAAQILDQVGLELLFEV
jgi:hypothetical protein